MTLLQAIAKREGYGQPGNRPTRNNNPGDLEFCKESEAFGADHGDPTFAVFLNSQDGWTALRRWLSVPAHFEPVEGGGRKLVAGYMGATLAEAITRFAPPSNNNTAAYIADVCTWTGLEPETILTPELLA